MASITGLTIAPGVREVASEDGAVLLDVEQGVCFSLNPVGLKIWDLLKKGCSSRPDCGDPGTGVSREPVSACFRRNGIHRSPGSEALDS